MRETNQKVYIGIVDTNYIVESIDIADGAQTIANQPDVPRNITITVTDANVSISAGVITILGTGINGSLVTETLDLTDALTLTGTEIFKTITSVTVSDLAGAAAGDTIIVGVGNTVQLTEGRTNFISAIVTDDGGNIGKYQFIDGITGTTTNVGELKQDIVAGVYEFNCNIALGLRVVISGDTKLTIIYEQI